MRSLRHQAATASGSEVRGRTREGCWRFSGATRSTGRGCSGHAAGAFAKKRSATATVRADEGSGAVVATDSHGMSSTRHTYVVEVQPDNGQPFRVETTRRVPGYHHPVPGDVVNLLYEEKGHKTEIVIEGDPRYDVKLRREQAREQIAHRSPTPRQSSTGPTPATSDAPAPGTPAWR